MFLRKSLEGYRNLISWRHGQRAGVEVAACTLVGALPLCRSCSGFRQSVPDAGCIGRSPKFPARARGGSTQLATVMRIWREACCRHSYASSSVHPCLQRVGAFRGRLLTSRVRPPAPPVPTRVSTHAMTAGTTHDSMTGQRISYEALWLGSNESCEHSHILQTALSQTAQWTGVFMCTLVALANPEAFVFLTLRLPGVCDLP